MRWSVHLGRSLRPMLVTWKLKWNGAHKRAVQTKKYTYTPGLKNEMFKKRKQARVAGNRTSSHLELAEVPRLGEEVREVGETDARELEVLQVDEGHRVSVEEGHVLLINVEDVVGRLLDAEALQVGTRVHEAREVEVIGRDELQRLDGLPHVGDVGRVLGERDMQFAGDAIHELDVECVGEHVAEIDDDLIDADLHVAVVLHRDL